MEDQKRGLSNTNLTNLSQLGKSRSTVRFVDDLPQGHGKGKGREDSREGDLKGKSQPTETLSAESDPDTDKNSDDGDDETGASSGAPPLPRTRSQLSMLIAQERRRSSGSLEIGPSPLLQRGQADQRVKGKEVQRENDGDEEDAEEGLVMMGRRDGVTKAGGVSQNNKKGKQKMMGEESREDFEFRSPTPPLF